MPADYTQQTSKPDTRFSFFTNRYTLTREMCAEAELSRIDVGLSFVAMTLLFVCVVFLSSVPDLLPSVPDAVYDYFSAPSAGTILELSGAVGITFVSPAVAILCLMKAFPKLVGEKRFQEQLRFLPSAARTLSFCEDHVTAEGGLRKKLPYRKLRRIGRTRNLYLLYFTEKRILPVDRHGFRKGEQREFLTFLQKRRTWRSRVYDVIRHIPPVLCFLFYAYMIWLELFVSG